MVIFQHISRHRHNLGVVDLTAIQGKSKPSGHAFCIVPAYTITLPEYITADWY